MSQLGLSTPRLPDSNVQARRALYGFIFRARRFQVPAAADGSPLAVDMASQDLKVTDAWAMINHVLAATETLTVDIQVRAPGAAGFTTILAAPIAFSSTDVAGVQKKGVLSAAFAGTGIGSGPGVIPEGSEIAFQNAQTNPSANPANLGYLELAPVE